MVWASSRISMSSGRGERLLPTTIRMVLVPRSTAAAAGQELECGFFFNALETLFEGFGGSEAGPQ